MDSACIYMYVRIYICTTLMQSVFMDRVAMVKNGVSMDNVTQFNDSAYIYMYVRGGYDLWSP